MSDLNEVFKKTGCVEDSDYKGVFMHEKLPFTLYDVKGYLRLCINEEYCISRDVIPTTEKSIHDLISALNP